MYSVECNMKVLVINLTRMGDLIQTIGLINAVHKLLPKARIDVLVMKAFASIVKHFEYVNDVIAFDDSVFNESIADDLWSSFGELYKIIDELNKKEYDILFNPIVSKQSSILAYLIKAKQKLGLQITENKEQKMTCDFTSYMLANQHSLGDFSFNLVDIFAGMIKDVECNKGRELLLPEYDEFRLRVFEGDLKSVGWFLNKVKLPPNERMIIGFHIGASQSNKAWNMGYYKTVIKELLIDREYIVVLFGGYKEKEFKSFFADVTSDLFFNTIGDFKVNELIAAVSSIDLLVTNDTGPMHIATACGVPVIDISLGPVSKWETGAYNENALIIEARLDCHPCSFNNDCQHWNCHHAIQPEVVVEAVRYKMQALRSQKYENKDGLPHFVRNDKVSFSYYDKVRFYTCGKDMFGFHSFKPLFKEEITKIEYVFLLKRFVWSLYFVDKWDDFGELKEQFMESIKASYDVPNFCFKELQNYLSELNGLILHILSDLEKVKNSEKSLDNNKEILLNVKRNKELLFSKAKEFELIYDWFWFFLFKESEIDDYEIDLIIMQTTRLYIKLKMKLVAFIDLLNMSKEK